MKTINTVYCAAITPMNSNYDIDYKGLKANIEWYIENGLGGILVSGGTGEFVSLSVEERMFLAESTVKEINGRTGFMVGCSAETTADSIRFAKHAQDIGADGLLLIASYYFKPSEEELYQHFKAVADSVSIPIVIYNNPGSCGTDLLPHFIKRISEIPNISHVKEATGDLFRVREIKKLCGDDFGVMCGCDELAYESLKNGATGWISITANALASQSQRIFDMMQNENYEEAWSLYKQILPLYSICEKPYKAIQTIKYILDKIGCCGGASRAPRLPLTVEEKIHIDSLMRKAGLI